MESVDVEGACHARPLGQPREIGRLIDGVLGHVPIRRPLAAGRRQQPGCVEVNRVIARQRRRQLAVSAFHQRPDADEDAQHVAASRRLDEVLGGGLEYELDFLRQWLRFERRVVDWRIGGADERVAVPGNREHDAAV